MTPVRHPLSALLFGMVLCGLSGCWGGPPYAEVTGVVTIDGLPLHSAEVVFFPDPEKSNPGPPARAYTDDNGHFELTTRQSGQAGALVGIHRVGIRDLTTLAMPPRAGLGEVTEDGPAPPPPPPAPKAARPTVPMFYGDPAATPFRDVEVTPGKQELKFNVESQRKS